MLDKKTREMYDNRRTCPYCHQPVRMLNCASYPGVPHVEVRCQPCEKTWVLKTPLETIKNRPTDVKISSSRNAIRDDDGTPVEEIGRYEVVFDFENIRYYCYLDAISVDEAVEMFLDKHPGVTMKHVADTLEV